VSRRLSLRTRLVLGLLVLAAVGLVAADFATYKSLSSFLFDRVDSTLNAAHPPVENAIIPQQFGPSPGSGPGPRGGRSDVDDLLRAIPGDCVQLRTISGSLIPRYDKCIPQFGQTTAPPKPRYPAKISLPSRPNTPEGDRVSFLTVPAKNGDGRYRVRASIEGRSPDYMLLIAAPLSSVDSTLHRLFLIELLVTAAVLAGLVALALWVVRLGLRPLVEIEHTAAAIGAGDLSQRVERAEPNTEIGRLGLALNAMLGQIERAFKAREATEAKLRRFVADASHELRTPLAAVRAYSELYRRGASAHPQDLDRAMSGINRESERMSVLVEDLLLLARLDEGRPLEREPVDLREVVGEAVETARTVEPSRAIDLEAEPAVVLGDRDRLRQVVDNLLSNVRSHTPPDGPVHVRVARNGADAVLEVADSGPGMDEEEVERVFERFHRGDPSRSRASGGVGLGLSIVAAVAEAHGGSASAESEPGIGSTFRIKLPLLSEKT
jgi:two-component system OmpR family sensor kinase